MTKFARRLSAASSTDCPGLGRPLLFEAADDPHWWLRQKLRDESLQDAVRLPGALPLN